MLCHVAYRPEEASVPHAALEPVVTMVDAARKPRYLPPIQVLLRGLGISELPVDCQKIEVSGRFLRHILGELARGVCFDADFYAKANPDVEAAVSAGQSPSLIEHFVTHGFFEGRLSAPIRLDPEWYARRYPDLAGLSAAELARHYAEYGRFEGRVGVPDDAAAMRWSAAVKELGTGWIFSAGFLRHAPNDSTRSPAISRWAPSSHIQRPETRLNTLASPCLLWMSWLFSCIEMRPWHSAASTELPMRWQPGRISRSI